MRSVRSRPASATSEASTQVELAPARRWPASRRRVGPPAHGVGAAGEGRARGGCDGAAARAGDSRSTGEGQRRGRRGPPRRSTHAALARRRRGPDRRCRAPRNRSRRESTTLIDLLALATTPIALGRTRGGWCTSAHRLRRMNSAFVIPSSAARRAAPRRAPARGRCSSSSPYVGYQSPARVAPPRTRDLRRRGDAPARPRARRARPCRSAARPRP